MVATRRRRLSRVLAIAGTVGVVVLLLPSVAGAAVQLSVPDTTHGSSYANCSWAVSTTDLSQDTFWRFACQTSGAVNTTSTATMFNFKVPRTSQAQSAFGSVSYAGGSSCAAPGCVVEANTGGVFRIVLRVFGSSGVADTTCKGTDTSAPAQLLGSIHLSVNGNDTTGTMAMLCPGSASTAYGSYPNDYFPGGTPGSNSTAPCFTVTPAVLPSPSAQGSPVTAALDATCSKALAGTTYGWTVTGPGSPVLSTATGTQTQLTMSVDGSYVVKLSATLGGVVTSYTNTIIVPTPSGSTPSEGTGTDQQSNCGTDFLLHPSYLVCWLKWLFVPSGDRINTQFQSLKNAVTSTWPVGPATWAVGQAQASANGYTAHATECDPGSTCTGEANLPPRSLDPASGCSSVRVTIPMPSGVPDQLLPILPSNCTAANGTVYAETPALATAQRATFLMSTAAAAVFGFLCAWGLARWLMGGGGNE